MPVRVRVHPRTWTLIVVHAVLTILTGTGTAQEALQAAGQTAPAANVTVRIFFISDVHSHHRHLARFIDEVNAQRPTVVLDGGDMVHDGTETEIRRAYADRERLAVPWYVTMGNHDADPSGPFSAPPPEVPPFNAVDHADVRFILIDNHRQVLTPEQFELLESELRRHAGRRIVVVMHVPPILSREAALTRLRHVLPYRLSEPTMRDPAQVARFTALMQRYEVLAVLAGHAHFPDYSYRGGVHYIVAGTAGGLTPWMGVDHGYLDIRIHERHVSVQRVPLRVGPRDPVSYIAGAFLFFLEVNRFNHAAQGWNYVPSASVQFKGGLKRIEARGMENVAMYGAASFERNLGGGRQALFVDAGASSGPTVLTGDLALGYKFRPLGDFNRGLFVGAAGTAVGGAQARRLSAGVGARFSAGAEWRSLTLEISRGWATDHRSASIGLGGRF